MTGSLPRLFHGTYQKLHFSIYNSQIEIDDTEEQEVQTTEDKRWLAVWLDAIHIKEYTIKHILIQMELVYTSNGKYNRFVPHE